MDSSDELDAELSAPQIRAGSPAEHQHGDICKKCSHHSRQRDKIWRSTKVARVRHERQVGQDQHPSLLNSMPVKSPRSFKQPDYTNVFNLIPEEEGPEVDLYPKFCDAVMKHKICPGYKFIPCDTKYDMDDKGKNKVDVGLHKMAGAPKDGRPNWINQSMWIEFKKKGNGDDAFNDSEQGPFEVESSHAAQVRGQLISYAEMAMNRQHRTHLYSVFVMHQVRALIRWDRAGAVVSEKFDYRENPEILGEFFWTLESSMKLFRLMDTMAEKVLPEPFDYIRQQFKDSLKEDSLKEDADKVDWPRYKLAVEDKEKGTRYFLVGGVMVSRLIWSDVQRGRHRHADVWRQMPERLRKASSSMDSAGDKRHPPSKLIHYRLVEKEVGQPLSEFKKSLELVKLISDCLIAHEDAVKLARVLHRDVSAGNMLMYPFKVTPRNGATKHVWTGLLNDWELSKPIARPGTVDVARREGRTGTWQFMSSAILDDKSRRPMIEDELESFFYVLVYYSVRYLKHNSKDVASFMLDVFDSYSFSNGEYSCGNGKRRLLENAVLRWPENRDVVFTGEGSNPHPLNDLIATMLPWFQGRYRLMELERKLRKPSSSGTQAQAEDGSPDKTETNEYVDVLTNEDLQDDDDDDPMAYEDKTDADGDKTSLTTNWPSEDKLGDQLPKEYTSKRTRGTADEDAATTGEKRRQEDILATEHLRKRPKYA
ncbi:hypothetical protein A0H81_06308 [Grifola frondosa]|uniref:Fungal-type protein kinase domain-containing protein n=1 Tax=Grifola frondosa TaxID=5627 RepID=A0A1C7MAQ6_GRIFR|nr:hypothetical protein A0H81_06308 [Grifola frondosa]